MPSPLLPAAYDVWWSIAVLATLVIVVVALVSISRASKSLSIYQALVWTVIAIVVPIAGPAAWFAIGRTTARKALTTTLR